jgi:formate-dependent nitrite reductase membrane component NrfD
VSGLDEARARAGGSGGERDTTPALGHPGEPGRWERSAPDATVALHVGEWRDGRWSYLYGDDTRYAPPVDGEIAESPRGRRDGEPPVVSGPMIHAPVWTWEVPVYFWFGGMSAGASFVAFACDLAGDEKAARICRRVALATVMPAPPLLIADLGRPARFLNMLRIFKPRSPMSMGSWALMAFSSLLAGAAGADLLGRRREARAINGAAALVGGYFGSYTGVLLASTAVPLWARSRLFLGPIFVCTGAATGAAACRLTLVACGLPEGHQTREALGRVETGAMTAELALSILNERRLGPVAEELEKGVPGRQFRAAKWLVRTGLALRFVRRRTGRPAHDVASVLYLLAGLLFRLAWVGAGKGSARDDEMVARMARGRTA